MSHYDDSSQIQTKWKTTCFFKNPKFKVDQFKKSLSSRDSISIGYKQLANEKERRMRAAYKPMTS